MQRAESPKKAPIELKVDVEMVSKTPAAIAAPHQEKKKGQIIFVDGILMLILLVQNTAGILLYPYVFKYPVSVTLMLCIFFLSDPNPLVNSNSLLRPPRCCYWPKLRSFFCLWLWLVSTAICKKRL